jgi:hypothetical protein
MSLTAITTETTIQPEEDVEVNEVWEEYQLIRQSSGEVEKQLWRLQRKREDLRTSMSDVRRKLMNICDHDWVRDPPIYQERSWHTCTKCGNSK